MIDPWEEEVHKGLPRIELSGCCGRDEKRGKSSMVSLDTVHEQSISERHHVHHSHNQNQCMLDVLANQDSPILALWHGSNPFDHFRQTCEPPPSSVVRTRLVMAIVILRLFSLEKECVHSLAIWTISFTC